MRRFERFCAGGCLTSAIRAILITEYLLLSVRADGADSEEQTDLRFALIGAGIGLFFAAVFMVIKIYMIRKHMLDNRPGNTMKRPSETLSLHSRRETRP
ncbi:transmembrane protein 273-like [Myripristis murdjan]|uniref:transmembrane protein 273-like n=1 Tax=Myripristis murdjan TaxID=586833 RepID=UPI001175CE0C|nr:transmembrane protein 273 [Myripristis murdjan]